MNKLPLEREALFPRIDGIQKNLVKLESLSRLPFKKFVEEDSYDLSQHHLRMALEGVFHIGAHILSRLPGARAVEYKEIATKLGEAKVVPKKFAQKALIPMAGMRNILVHHYADIDPKKFYDIIKNHRQDIEKFLQCVKAILSHPKKFGLTLT